MEFLKTLVFFSFATALVWLGVEAHWSVRVAVLVLFGLLCMLLRGIDRLVTIAEEDMEDRLDDVKFELSNKIEALQTELQEAKEKLEAMEAQAA